MVKVRKQLPVTLEELVVSSLAQVDALSKVLIEKGIITPTRISRQDFRGAGNISTHAESHQAVSRNVHRRNSLGYGLSRYR